MQLPTIAVPREMEPRYVKLMLDVMGRAFEAASQIDPVFQKETRNFRVGYLFEMSVLPHGPAMVLEKQADGSMRYLGDKGPYKSELNIRFKHIAHAFLVLSFQESTSRAFANDRMLLDGEVADAMRMVRCLNRLEAFILPKFVAEKALKRYPDSLDIQEKLTQATRIYSRVATNFVKGVLNG
jgi:hypothetical protein